eukprot:RCo012390
MGNASFLWGMPFQPPTLPLLRVTPFPWDVHLPPALKGLLFVAAFPFNDGTLKAFVARTSRRELALLCAVLSMLSTPLRVPCAFFFHSLLSVCVCVCARARYYRRNGEIGYSCCFHPICACALPK